MSITNDATPKNCSAVDGLRQNSLWCREVRRFILPTMIFEEIPLNTIDYEDETFRISEDLDLASMIPSLQAVGLIHPVVLVESATPSNFMIVCGFRRLHGLRSVGSDMTLAGTLKSTEHSRLELFLKAIWDNLSHREMAPLEAARILYKLRNELGLENDILVERFLPLLGLSPHRNVLQGYLHLHQLHPELRSQLNAGQLTLSSAERLAQAAPEIQAGAARTLGKVRLSASLQREVLDLAEDLAAITNTTLTDVFDQPEIQAVGDDARLSAFQKGEKIHGYLYALRNPRIAKARENFQAEKAGLALPGTVRISADPFFETPRLRVEFDVASPRAFRETIDALATACRKASLDRLFEVS
jgi:ParB-like chromosome segregation protein Spo0J